MRAVIDRTVLKRSSGDNVQNQGSVISSWIDVQDRVALSLARNCSQGERSTQAATVARLPSARATRPSRPPTDSAHFNESIASSTHSIDGVLIVSPRKMPSINLPPEVMRKIFGRGQGGV